MKKLLRNLSVLCLTLVAFLTTGCYEEEIPFLKVDHEVVLVGPQTDKGTVVVESNVNWTVESKDEWITIDNGFGNHKGTFEFFVAANTTPNERSGKITLSADGVEPVTILVRQQSEGSILTLGTEEITFTKDAGDYLMAVACNGEWKVASSASWCTVDPTSGTGNGSFKISVDENTTGADRSAVITILTEADGKTEVRKVNVFQSASNAVLVVSPESKQLTAAASDFTLAVVTVGSWNASIDSDWLTLSATEGKGDAMITVSATKNDTGKERIAIITFATGAENENRVIRQIVVRQAAVDFYLIAPVTNYPLSLEAQTIDIPYVLEGSNVTVDASSSVKWMTVAGVADGVVTVNVAENGTAQAREGIISIFTKGQEGEPIVRQVRVAQAPTINLLDVLADEYAVEWTGATFRIPIYSNTDVTARSSEDWCTVAVDGSDVVITVPQNDTAAPRVAVVTVTTSSDTGEILSKTTLIHQAAAYSELVVSPEKKNIYSPAQSFIASIVTNNTWTASSDSDWLTIDKANGTGDYMLTVSATANTTGRVRTATITIETGIENAKRETATITVVQSPEQFFLEVPARYYPLSLEAQDIEIPYSVEGSNVTIAVSSNVTWMTVATIGEDKVTVNVAENTTGQAREGIITFMTKGQVGDPVVAQVVVAQAPTINLLDVLADEYAVEWTGETFRIPMYTNTPVTVRCTDDWCKVSVDGQDIVVEVAENLTAYAREAVVTVTTNSDKGDILNRTFVVRQAAAYSELVVAPTEKNIYSDAQNFVASIVTNNSWTASSDSEWLTIDKTAGNGDYTLTVTVAKNETGQARTAVITIQTGIENSQRETATITVLQRPEQFYFEVPTRAYLLDKFAQPLTIAYTTSGNEKSVTASAGADWIRVGEVADGVVNLVIEENKTAETRTSTVTVTCTPVFGDPVSITATITQSPTINILDAFVDVIDAMARGDEVALPYYANTPVSISSSETWCHVEVTTDPNSFNASCCSYSELQKIIKIEVDPNRTGEPRVAYVTISTVSDSGEKITKVITVRQAALYAALSVTPKEVVIPAHNAEFTMTVNTTGTWWATNSCTWLTNGGNTDAAGFGDDVIDWTAADNDTGYDRRAQITVATGPENNEREEQVVNVIQLKQDTYIYIPIGAYAITKEQQTLPVHYFAAGDFTDMQVNCSEPWIVYAGGDDTTLNFDVEENTTAEPRTAIVTVTLQLKAGEPITDSFIVTQAPTINILDAYVSTVNASPWGERVILPFYTNTDVTAVSSDDRWCHVICNPNTDPGDLVILVDKNEDAEARTAYVTLTTITDKGEKITHIITVNQKPLNAALIVSPERVVLPATNAAFDMTIATTGTWDITVDAAWLAPDLSTGDGDYLVTWTLDDNTTGMQREATILVFTGTENETRVEKTVQVIQLATDTYLEVPQSAFAISKEQQDLDVICITAGDITNTVFDVSETWLTVTSYDQGTSTLSLKAEENTTGEARTAIVTVTIEKASGDPETVSFTVTQSGTYNTLDVLQDYIVLLTEGETVVLPAITNVETVDKTVSATWVTADVSLDANTKTAEIKIEAAENTTGKDRTAYVTVYTATGKGETLAKTITVFQPARDVLFSVLTTDVVYIDHEKQDITIAAYANVNADNIQMYSSSESWLQLTTAPSASNNVATAVFTALENKTFDDRTGVIKIDYTDENGEVHSEVVTVVQSANDDYLETLTDYIVLDPINGETKTLSFLSNNDVTATSSSAWISVTYSGTEVEITAPANTTGRDRTGYVTVVNDKLKVLVTVFQPAADHYFAVLSPDLIQIAKKPAASVEIAAYASINADNIEMKSGASWLAYESDALDGTNVAIFKFKAEENMTGKVRSTVVKINWTDEKGEEFSDTVTVVQSATDGAELEALVDQVILAAIGESINLTFETEDALTATPSAAWFSATIDNTTDPQVLTITATENTTGYDREGYVTVSNGSQSVVIKVFQPAKDTFFKVLSADQIYIDNTSQTVEILAYASVNADQVTMESGSTWLAVNTVSASGTQVTGTFDAAENATFEPRTAEVKITFYDEKGDAVEKTVTVIQSSSADVLEALVDYIVLDPKTAETVTLSFISNNNVSAASSASWVSVSASNKDVEITGSINDTGRERTAYVTVTNNNLKKVVTVFQPAADQYFAVLSPDYIQVGKATGTQDVVAYASINADKIEMEPGANWLTVNTSGATGEVMTYTFDIAENKTGATRSALVKINWTDEKGEEFSDTVTIVQSATDGGELEALVDTVVVAAAGEDVTLTFDTDDVITATPSATWLSAAVDATTDPQQVTITATANDTGLDREGYVTVSNGSESVIITVFQPAALTEFAVISPDVIYIDKAEQDVVIKAYGAPSTDNMQQESNSGWLAFQTKTASGTSYEGKFKAAANTSGVARSAEVKLTFIDQKGESQTATVTVIQAATEGEAILEAMADYLTVDALGETMTISFTANDAIASAVSSATWLGATLDATTATVEITAAENTTGKDRTAYLTVKNSSKTKVVTVFQPAKNTVFALISTDVITIGKGSIGDVPVVVYASPISSVDAVEAASSADWFVFNGNKSLSGNELTAFFDASDNLGSEPRTAQVKLTFIDDKGETHVANVTVYQAAAQSKLIVPVTALSASAAGETLDVGIISDPDATVTDTPSWISASYTAGVVSMTVAANETGYERTGNVQVSNGSEMASITVYQPAADAFFELVSADVVHIASTTTGTIPVVVWTSTDPTINGGVQAEFDVDWATVTLPGTSSGNLTTFDVTAADNTTGASRTAVGKLTYINEKGEPMVKYVTIVQASASGDNATLKALVDKIAVSPAGESIVLSFDSSDALVSAVAASPWITGATVDATNNTVTITAEPNNTGYDRTTYVTVKNSTLSEVVEVFQPAVNNNFALTSADVLYLPKSVTGNITVSAYATLNQGTVVGTPNVDWITVGSVTPNGNFVDMEFTVADNDTDEVRTADIKVVHFNELNQLEEEHVTIIQAATENVFNIPVDYLAMDAAGEVKKVAFISTKDITVTAPGGWLTATKNTDDITIETQPNTTGKDRTGVVYVSNGDEIAAITVFQPAATTSFKLLNPKMAVGNTNDTYKFHAFGSTGVTADNLKAEPSVSWLTVTGIDVTSSPIAEISVEVAANPSGLPRTGLVTVTWIDESNVAHSDDIQIAQSTTENILDIYLDEVALATAGGEYHLMYYTTADAATMVATSSDNSWLTAVNTSGDVNIKAAKNETAADRTGYVTVKATFADGTSQTKLITVHQYAADYFFTLVQNNFQLGNAAQTISVDYYCTEDPAANVQAYFNVDWITVNDLSGNPLKFDVAERPAGPGNRQGTITLYYSLPGKAPIVQTITVRQQN